LQFAFTITKSAETRSVIEQAVRSVSSLFNMSLPTFQYCNACKDKVRGAVAQFPGRVGRGYPCQTCLQARIHYVDELYKDRIYRNHLAAQYYGLPCARICRAHPEGYEYFPEYYHVDPKELGLEYQKTLLKAFDHFDRPSPDTVSGLEVLMEESEYCDTCYWKANERFPSGAQGTQSARDAVMSAFSPEFQNIVSIKTQQEYSKEDALLCASVRRMQDIYSTNFHVTLCPDCLTRRKTRIESLYGQSTFDYQSDMQHVSFKAQDVDERRNLAYWREVLELENVTHLDRQWREFFLGAEYYRLDEFVQWGAASTTVLNQLSTAGPVASIANGVYTRRAARAQQAAART
jgi:hypothetical protein